MGFLGEPLAKPAEDAGALELRTRKDLIEEDPPRQNSCRLDRTWVS